MVANESQHARVGSVRRDQQVDDASGIGTSIDIVAEMHDAPLVRAVAGELFGDALMHPLEQIEAAVHVADGVEAHAVRRSRVEEMDPHTGQA